MTKLIQGVVHLLKFPIMHPHATRRSACNEVLMKMVKIGGKYKLIPRKVYMYQSVICSLKSLCKHKGFLEKCENWRYRQAKDDMMGDVYDGNLWKDLQTIQNRPFLSLPNNLCLALNVDWFNPYKETQFSVGAIYLVVLNLPRL